MLAWMLYAIAASILIGAAALALEGAMHGMRRPTRFVWAGAMLLSTVWPVFMLVVPRSTIGAPAIRTSVSSSVHAVSNTVALASERTLNVSVQTIVLTIWALLSAILIGRVMHAFYTNAIRSKGWRFATVEGIQVRTSTDVGPAVIGIASMEVVLPEWVLALDRTLLDLVLAHEQEHRDARDPMLLFGAAIMVCLMPWNVALIWQTRRLRSAMEVDCDARVLRRYPDAERYGLLLLAIAQRRSSASPILVATMSEPAANLSRRFAAMKDNQISRLRLAALCTIGLVAIVAAGAIDSPTTLQAKELPSTTASLLAYAHIDTSKATRFCVDATNDYPGICLEFPTTKFDEPQIAELSKRLVVDYTRTLGRTRSNDAATEAVLGVIAQIERLIGEPVQVWIGDTRLSTPEREATERAKGRSIAKAMTVTDSNGALKTERGKVLQAPATDPAALQERQKVDSSKKFFDFQVEVAAALKQGTMNLVYPETLKNAGVEGEVVVQFVVNTDGTADLGTFKVLKSTDPLFTAAVREALAQAVFTPASVGGRQVRQLLQLPFSFSIK